MIVPRYHSIGGFLAPPVFEADADKTRVAGLLNTTLLFLYATPLVLVVNAIFTPVNRILAVPLAAVLVAVLSAMENAMRRGYVRAASVVLVAFLLLLLTFLAFLGGGESRPLYIYYTLVIAMAGLLLGGRGAVMTAIGSAVVAGVLTYAGAAGLIAPLSQAPVPALSWLTLAVGFVLIGAVLRLASHSLGAALDTERRSRSELQRLAATLEQRVEERTAAIALLHEMGDRLQACHTVDEAYTVIALLAHRLFPDEAGALYRLTASRDQAASVAVWGAALPDLPQFESNECWGLRHKQLHVVELAAAAAGATPGEPAVACGHVRPPQPAATVCVPLVAQGEAFGLLHMRYSPEAGHTPAAPPGPWFTEVKQQLIQTVADSIALALASLELRETLRQQSIRDPLTDLYNRRYMEETLERELRRALRDKSPLGIIMLDIDHFKRFNDTFGHEAGDSVLRDVGACLREQLRTEDIACRYGGEEFTLIMPTASLAVTQQRAEQVRERVKCMRVEHHGQALGPITASLGVAVFPEHGDTGEAVLAQADAALYRAKREGRDRVAVAEALK